MSNNGAQTKQRTCIVCREPEHKHNLARVVRTPEGEVLFDPTGRANGRGAYICSLACCEKAFKSKAIERALRVKLHEDDYERLGSDLFQKFMGEK